MIDIDKMEIATRLRSFRENRGSWEQWIFLRYRDARILQFELVRQVCEALTNAPIRTKFELFIILL